MLRTNITRAARVSGIRAFHASAAARAQSPKSPLQVFYETFKTEVKKSNELKDSMKALSDETGRMAESDSFKKAKEAYDKAQQGRSAAGEVLKKTGEAVGSAAVKAWESPVGKATRTTVVKTAEVVDKVMEPVRQTQAYKDLSEVIDDGSSTAYGGFVTKEQRERYKETELKENYKRIVKANEEAGNALVATDIKPDGPSTSEKWEAYKVQTPVGRFVADTKMKWDESENGLISLVRTVGEKVGGFFSETETARVYRQFKEMDPTFTMNGFQEHLRNYIIPEILDSYVKNDEKVLKEWLSEAPFNIWQAQTKQFTEQGLFSDSRILDIRGIDIMSAKLLPPNNVPVVVVSCRAQEVALYRNAKTGEIAAGTLGNIQLSTYAMVLTRIPEELDNPETGGWKIMEFVRGGSRQFT
ncbi:hypothetical protein BABINDRAFT_161697 [Babjeviella inositovora NRRL Y-12698]|uniref:Mitochondrial import inner membrane translocase subunit TIM44 n=1 Tax=Babjeviella inositovora NRRL Y-12698 TaxID=984486 RepID=A0A1E3QQY4_9ASCO|nr:uncharacterized protein BABINDRAFT_161697 [Babjeviella inositovora NRRL Y-12698]ODQ80060.1 hypothetical protein BABINDRAFT_161697 [Babjeviella inositovora NRRL Y-12698]